ncbi:MAG: iron-sulfur cluster assembly scaffold protein [Parachlamydiaceae bacterium]|nr:iron-sulfur cluster assembly scaffold protein [Parachlamydiaceae bacterium]
MSLTSLTQPFPWYRYSKKLANKIDNPHNVGLFTKEESEARTMFLADSSEGSLGEGNSIRLYLLVDNDDGVIVDARFQAFGQSALIGAAEAACELLVGKNYDQAKRINADLIDRQVRDKSDEPAFPREAYPHLNLVLSAIEIAADKCTFIPFASSYTAPPVPAGVGSEVVEGGYPGWVDLPLKKKIAVIEEVLDRDVRPYIELDAGGVHVLDLLNDQEVIISYSGACTSCYSSIGTTLSYIQQTLRNKISPSLTVTPNINL